MVAFMTTTTDVRAFTLVASATWLFLHVYVRHNGPISVARPIIKLNSWIYSVASFLMFLIIIIRPIPPVDTYVGLSNGLSDDYVCYIYHLSKFYEFIDIILVCAAGSSINLHFGFHHLTTPYLTLFRFLDGHEGWRVFAAANTLHHVLMYAYFGGASLLRPLLPWTGTIQLLLGISADLVLGMRRHSNGGDIWPYLFSVTLLLMYFVLHVRDLKARRI
ncbi:hypothetical protein BJX64DRAFT_256827 [Aspergillus heterothallicus]